MLTARPKQLKRIFEARYDRGFRYLDRCGEVLLILDEMLPGLTKKVWMTEEARPTGARIKCPELDIRVTFDSAIMNVLQDPVPESEEFVDASEAIFSTIKGRFDLRDISRFGNRSITLLPTDSIEQSLKMSLEYLPLKGWPTVNLAGLSPASTEVVQTLESEDGRKGVRFSVQPFYSVAAPEEVDERLKVHPRFLPKDQRRVLLAQLQAQRTRDKTPVAGLQVDVDVYQIRPERPDVRAFLKEADELATSLRNSIFEGKSK